PVVQKVKAMGYRVESDSEAAQNANRVLVVGPDGIRVQLIANSKQSDAIALFNVRLASSDPQAMQAWYEKIFGAVPLMQDGVRAATLPGVTLLFVQSTEPRAPSVGTAIDHIGFEIRNLKDFVAAVGSAGATTSRPYSEFGPEKLGFSFMVDPWGTNIEL